MDGHPPKSCFGPQTALSSWSHEAPTGWHAIDLMFSGSHRPTHTHSCLFTSLTVIQRAAIPLVATPFIPASEIAIVTLSSESISVIYLFSCFLSLSLRSALLSFLLPLT